jgi:alpha-beta hydrolase superfamily lysophospholipase
MSLRLIAAIMEGCRYALANAPKLAVPTYIAYAKGETVVCNKAIERFIAASNDNVTNELYEYCHAIHADRDKEKLFADVTAFYDTCIAGENHK